MQDDKSAEPQDKMNDDPVDMRRRAALAKLRKLTGVGAVTAVSILSSARIAAASP